MPPTTSTGESKNPLCTAMPDGHQDSFPYKARSPWVVLTPRASRFARTHLLDARYSCTRLRDLPLTDPRLDPLSDRLIRSLEELSAVAEPVAVQRFVSGHLRSLAIHDSPCLHNQEVSW